MFLKARLKLTAWYLAILMTVSLSFSFVIYRASIFELSRFAQAQRQRFDHRVVPQEFIDEELFLETRRRIIVNLGIINLGILAISSVLGYYLSGKTLAPIQIMVEEQKRFISDASHELKTPITAIKTTLEVALRDKNIEKIEAMQTIKDSLEEADKLQSLAEGLLELSHNTGIGNIDNVKVDSLISGAIKIVLPIAKKSEIALKVEKHPNVNLAIDQISMERALIAIFDNAIKYSPKNTVINIFLKVVDRNIVITIADQGVGIKKADLTKIFDRFYRADESRHSNGYGLGLSIAKKLIEANSGKIEIASKEGAGTMVKIVLPLFS